MVAPHWAGWEASVSHLGFERALGMWCGTVPLSVGALGSSARTKHSSSIGATDLSGFVLEFLTRPDCQLCEAANQVGRRAARLTRSVWVEILIDEDPELAVDWGLRIPVIRTGAGKVLAEGRIGFWRLLAATLSSRLAARLAGR